MVDCAFRFEEDQDVTEMTENIFAQFEETVTDEFNIEFNDKHDRPANGSLANFAFDHKTTGRLQLKKITIKYFFLYGRRGPEVFTDLGLVKSRLSLESLEIVPFYYQFFTWAPNFLADLENLKELKLTWYIYELQPFHGYNLNNLEHLYLESTIITDLTSTTFPTMPKLKNLEVPRLENISHLKNSGFFQSFPILESFVSYESKIETIDAGFFNNASNLRSVHLTENQITSIGLTGLGPNTIVSLEKNYITELTEDNFRPFVENVINTPGARGYIGIYGSCHWNWLKCSCDLKWLVVELDAAHVFSGAYCEGCIPLENVDPEAINEQCPDN